MEITPRQATEEDAQQMLRVYDDFAKQFVGSASRTIRNFRTMLRKKDNINWVALDQQEQIIGYIHARLEKRLNRGEFREIVVHPKHAFEHVAKPLVEKVHSAFLEKKVSAITAGSIRNPAYEKLFPALGFFESESTNVFMYAVLNVQKFLNELSQVVINRLKHLEDWNGVTQIECEGHSLFVQKANEKVQPIVWTNQPVNLKITLPRELLIKLVFGTADPLELHKNGQLKVETTESPEKVNRLLKTLFPKAQFLIMDYW